jgi:hypothetical protein
VLTWKQRSVGSNPTDRIAIAQKQKINDKQNGKQLSKLERRRKGGVVVRDSCDLAPEVSLRINSRDGTNKAES